MANRFTLDQELGLAPLPEPLPRPCVDSHAHLELVTESEPDSPAIKAILDEAASVGIDRIVQVGYSAAQSAWGVRCAEAWPGRVLAAVALHPNEAPIVEDLEVDLAIIEKLALHPRVRAIGETGLDFYRTAPELRAKQKYSFVRHIALAKSVNKALVIHDRDAHQEVLDTLLEEGAPEVTVFHCFSGDVAMAKECIESGYILSFAGTITFKNAPALRAAVRLVPLNQLLVETDSPFLTPAPNRGRRNTPAQIPHIINMIADERDQSVVELCEALSLNSERIFGSFE